MDSASACILWGCRMDLLRDFPFTFLLCLSSLPCSATLWGAHNPTHFFLVFFSVAALQKQRGGPGRVNSVSSSISWSSDLQSEIPGVGWGQCYRQELVSWSPSRLTEHPRPTEIPWGIFCFIQMMEGQWNGGMKVPAIAPDYVRLPPLPLQVRGKSLILRLVVLYFWKRNHFLFLPYTFSSCLGLTQAGT